MGNIFSNKKLWRNDITMIKEQTIIGKGGTSKIVKGRFRKSKNYIVLKQPRFSTDENGKKYLHNKIRNSLYNELDILKSLQESNKIVKLMFLSDEYLNTTLMNLKNEEKLLYEYSIPLKLYENDLFNIMSEQFLDKIKLKSYIKEIVKGLKYIHSKNIVHRDIKPENIFIDKYDNAVIGDFGFSKKNIYTLSGCTTIVGTMSYIAPEVHTKNYGYSVDYYNLGVLLYTCLFMEVYKYSEMKEKNHTKDFLDSFFMNCKDSNNENIDKDTIELLSYLLVTEPSNRGGIAFDLLELKYFEKVK